MQVIPLGTKVKTKLASIEGIITAISIRGNGVSYEVSYFNNGERKDPWMYESELEYSGEKQKVGFKK